MANVVLDRVIKESRALRSELRVHLDARKAIARRFRDIAAGGAARPMDSGDVRVVQMTSLLLEAHALAVRDEDGLTIDVMTDALTHLQDRLEREVMPKMPA